jgi:hypothetical protein
VIQLGHRRLAIQDPSARADQPFADSTGRRWLTFNPDFRFDCGTFTHPISRHALICAGSMR